VNIRVPSTVVKSSFQPSSVRRDFNTTSLLLEGKKKVKERMVNMSFLIPKKNERIKKKRYINPLILIGLIGQNII